MRRSLVCGFAIIASATLVATSVRAQSTYYPMGQSPSYGGTPSNYGMSQPFNGHQSAPVGFGWQNTNGVASNYSNHNHMPTSPVGYAPNNYAAPNNYGVSNNYNMGIPAANADQAFRYPSSVVQQYAPGNSHQVSGYGRWQAPQNNSIELPGGANVQGGLGQPVPANGQQIVPGQTYDPIPQQEYIEPQGQLAQPQWNHSVQQPHQTAPHGGHMHGGTAQPYSQPNYGGTHHGYGAHQPTPQFGNVHSYGHQPGCNGNCGGGCMSGMGGYQPGVYGDQSPYFDAMSGSFGGGSCVACGVGPCQCRRRGGWFGGIAGLLMARDYESNEYFSYYGGDPRNSILTSRTVELGTIGGYQFSVGRVMNCGWAWMATYWGLSPDEVTVGASGMPDTRLFGLNYVDYTPNGFGANNMWGWYNGSESHRVRRDNEFHNIELNFLRGSASGVSCGVGAGCGVAAGGCGDQCGNFASCCGPNWDFQWMFGARFFRFDEFFQYAASTTGTYVYAPREFYYDIETENNLVGFQLGGTANRAITNCLSVFGGTKFGVYNNRIQHSSQIYGPSGYATINQGSYAGTDFNVQSTKDDLAFMAEVDLGMRYQFSRCWRAMLGYRALVVSGVALAPDQIPQDFTYVPEIRYVDSDGALLLHGIYAGLEFRR